MQMADLPIYDLPDERGHFGPYGGVFVAETLIHALDELKAAYARYPHDPEFIGRVRARAQALRRPAVARLSRRSAGRAKLGGAQI